MDAKSWRIIFGAAAYAISTLSAGGFALAEVQALSPPRLMEVCSSETVAEATAKGNQLGWDAIPATDPDTVKWRQSFMSYNGGTVDVVGWRKTSTENEELISFWVAQDPNAHTACAYTVKVAGGLLDALIELLGRPSNLDKNEVATTALWKRGSQEISFAQVGSGAEVVISP
ncbi:hypothetical protein [Rhizobium sp. BR 362]|uniref:hypothetical protein n=1 Tax=Rhizobium sp. BR 362 TaxID=3040670 RepID=UPI002F3E8564